MAVVAAGARSVAERMASTADREALERRLAQVLTASPLVSEVLALLRTFGSESLWLGAGTICDTVWNAAHGFAPVHGIRDLDIVYFDPDLTVDDDAEMAAQVHGLVGRLGLWVDVKNQANVHVWYPAKFGAAITPYTSLDEAVATWPTTCGAIAVQLADADLVIKSPFGLVVRPNRVQAPRSWYEQKSARWRTEWPDLSILDWEDGVGDVGARLVQP